MPLKVISVEVEVRDDREAEQVKKSLDHILSLNGATGVLNLFDELSNSMVARNMVKAIATKFRRKDRS